MIRKAEVNFKIYDVTDWKKTIAIQMYDVTDWTTNNYNTYIAKYLKQTMKFGHLIKYNVTHIFLEKSCTECGGEYSSRSFYKNSKLSTPLDQQLGTLF